MPKLFIPPLKTKLRLTAPLTIKIADTINHYGNSMATEAAVRVNHPNEHFTYKLANAITEFTLEEGTVIEFKRYHLSSQAHMDAVKVSIFAAPRRDLTPRNRGGTGSQVVFEVPSTVLNGLEYEVADV